MKTKIKHEPDDAHPWVLYVRHWFRWRLVSRYSYRDWAEDYAAMMRAGRANWRPRWRHAGRPETPPKEA